MPPLVTFGLQDGLIAPRTGSGEYGDGIDIPFLQMINATTRTLSAEGTGDMSIVALGAIAIAGNVQIRMQGVPLDVLAIIYGSTIYEEGIDDTLIRTLPVTAGQRYPYWAVVGQGLETEGQGDQLFQALKCKVTSDIVLGTMEYGVLSSVEFTATALGEEGYPIFHLQHRATTAEFDLPLADTEVP